MFALSFRKLYGPILVISALTALTFAGSAYAAPLPTGASRYMRVVRLRDGNWILRLTPAGKKQFRQEVRGKILIARCVRLRRTAAGLVSASTRESLGTIRGPHGHPIDASFVDPKADFCDIYLGIVRKSNRGTIEHDLPGPPLDNVALTERGAGYLNEDEITFQLLATIDLAEAYAAQHRPGYFPPPRVMSKLPLVVALRSARSLPPANRVGYFRYGTKHAEVVAVTAFKRRLFIAIRDGILRTNAGDHIVRVLTDKLSVAESPPTPV